MTDRNSFRLGYMNGYADGVGDFRNAMERKPSGFVPEPPTNPRIEDSIIPEVGARMMRKGLADEKCNTSEPTS